MKQLLFGFIAFGFIVSGCASKEEAKVDTAAPVATESGAAACTDATGKCDHPDCVCDHGKNVSCAECQKSGKSCEACKKSHGCKDCVGKDHGKDHGKHHGKKDDKKKKSK